MHNLRYKEILKMAEYRKSENKIRNQIIWLHITNNRKKYDEEGGRRIQRGVNCLGSSNKGETSTEWRKLYKMPMLVIKASKRNTDLHLFTIKTQGEKIIRGNLQNHQNNAMGELK